MQSQNGAFLRSIASRRSARSRRSQRPAGSNSDRRAEAPSGRLVNGGDAYPFLYPNITSAEGPWIRLDHVSFGCFIQYGTNCRVCAPRCRFFSFFLFFCVIRRRLRLVQDGFGNEIDRQLVPTPPQHHREAQQLRGHAALPVLRGKRAGDGGPNKVLINIMATKLGHPLRMGVRQKIYIINGPA